MMLYDQVQGLLNAHHLNLEYNTPLDYVITVKIVKKIKQYKPFIAHTNNISAPVNV